MKAPSLLVLLPWLAGCAAGTSGPVEIAYGLEECAYCRMIISDPRHAVAARTAAGAFEVFDDVGCLLSSRRDAPEAPLEIWVHDVETEAWLEAAAARFLREDRAATPMGFGFVAVASDEAAARRGGPASTVYDWNELVAAGAAAVSAEQRPPGIEPEARRREDES